MPNHAHPAFHELIVVAAGEMETRILGRDLRARRGEVLFYPRGAWHAERALGEEPLETFFLAWRPGGSGTSGFPLHGFDRTGRIAVLVRWMHELFPPRRAAEEAMLLGFLKGVLLEFLRTAQADENSPVEAARRFIAAHLDERLTLDRLADTAGLSKFHFLRVFRRETGLTPMAFLRRRRLEIAQGLLLTTPLKLRVLARQVGFSDEYQFSRAFKRVLGESPGAMRRRAARMDRSFLRREDAAEHP